MCSDFGSSHQPPLLIVATALYENATHPGKSSQKPMQPWIPVVVSLIAMIVSAESNPQMML